MARKPNKLAEAEGALANLTCLVELAIEARAFGEDPYAVIRRNAHDINRWAQVVIAGGLALPKQIDGSRFWWDRA